MAYSPTRRAGGLRLLRAAAAAAVVAAAHAAAAAEEEVCLTGYVMDTFCIDRGTLLDNPDVVTLEGPDEHSVHCLVDVPRCYNSGFELLGDPDDPGGAYCRTFKFDGNGNALVLEKARAAGSTSKGCTTCTGGDEGSQKKGYRATITGTYDPADSRSPRILTVTNVASADVTCAVLNAGNKSASDYCSGTGGAATALVVAHGALMLAGWGVLLPTGVIVAHFLRHRDPLWFKLHRALQIGGLCCAVAGFLIAVTQFSVFSPGYFAPAQAHGSCGVVVMTLGIMQPINAYFRPHAVPQTPQRQKWEWLHKGSGWFALLLSFVTIVLGATIAGGGLTSQFRIAHFVFVGLLALLAAALWRDRGKQRAIAAGRQFRGDKVDGEAAVGMPSTT